MSGQSEDSAPTISVNASSIARGADIRPAGQAGSAIQLERPTPTLRLAALTSASPASKPATGTKRNRDWGHSAAGNRLSETQQTIRPAAKAPESRGNFRHAKLYLGEGACLAGVVGFEPTVHGTKNRCLTTWLHPNRLAFLTQSGLTVQAPPERKNDIRRERIPRGLSA